MSKLKDFFQEPGYEIALDRYKEIADNRGWPITTKLELYNSAKLAFESSESAAYKQSEFRHIYETLKNYWKVFRNAKGSIWSSDQVFEALINDCQACSRQSGLSSLNVHINSNEGKEMLDCLKQLREIKPQNYYPWVAVGKFTHFFNPKLFPIYDIAIVWNIVLNGVFKDDYRRWCGRNGLYWNDQTVKFNLNYICFAADLIRGADESFMPFFDEWFKEQVEGYQDDHNILEEVHKYYATAFEFVAIGASHL